MRKSITLPLLACLALLLFTILFVTSFDIAITSSAQNANSSTTTDKNQNDTRSISPAGGAQKDFSKNTWELPADADKTKHPTPTTAESIAKGKELYLERTK